MKILTVATETLKRMSARLTVLLFVALLTAAPFNAAMAQAPPALGTAKNFAVLGASAVTNTGSTVVTGDLGISPGSAITGFPPGTVVGGSTYVADAVAAQAQLDNASAYANLASQACNTTYSVPTDIGGLKLAPGVYCFASSAHLTGALSLDAGGDPSAVWVFKMASTFVTASDASVLLVNGAEQCNVSWNVGSSATIGTGSRMVGNLLALTSITLTTNATLSGRALAQTGAVTMDSDAVSISACTVAPLPPTLNKSFNAATIDAGGVSTLTITLSNPGTTAAVLTAPLVDKLPIGVVVHGNASNDCGGTITAAAGSSTVTLTGGSIPANGSCTVTVDVSAASAGNYFNSLATGSLQTDQGRTPYRRLRP